MKATAFLLALSGLSCAAAFKIASPKDFESSAVCKALDLKMAGEVPYKGVVVSSYGNMTLAEMGIDAAGEGDKTRDKLRVVATLFCPARAEGSSSSKINILTFTMADLFAKHANGSTKARTDAFNGFMDLLDVPADMKDKLLHAFQKVEGLPAASETIELKDGTRIQFSRNAVAPRGLATLVSVVGK